LGSNKDQGLSYSAIKSREQEFGKNKLPKEKAFSSGAMFFSQLKNPLLIILIIAGAIVLALRNYLDALIIWAAIFINLFISFFQENKAEKALEKLRKTVRFDAQVLRDGELRVINSENLVPGDIFFLKPGDKIPADARIIENFDLKINEAVLTGEWLPAEKKINALPEKTPLADRDNMVYMGTIVVDGKAKAITTSIGVKTEMGKIASLIKQIKEEKTPLQKKLARLSKIIGISIILVCILIFFEGILTGNSFLEMFTTALAVAV
ncbi:unnamed protein product, partial [marine sediment metagenome]